MLQRHLYDSPSFKDTVVSEGRGQRSPPVVPPGSLFYHFRKQMLTYREQQLAKLEDAEFTLEQRHKHLMSDIIRVYSESLAAYESAHDDQVTSQYQRPGRMAPS